MTTLLKEDGSLDIERINNLPREEKIREMGKFTRAQMNEYVSKMPINESHTPVKVIKVDYTMEDLLARGCGTIEDIHRILTT
jgi:hypothetical protein